MLRNLQLSVVSPVCTSSVFILNVKYNFPTKPMKLQFEPRLLSLQGQ